LVNIASSGKSNEQIPSVVWDGSSDTHRCKHAHSHRHKQAHFLNSPCKPYSEGIIISIFRSLSDIKRWLIKKLLIYLLLHSMAFKCFLILEIFANGCPLCCWNGLTLLCVESKWWQTEQYPQTKDCVAELNESTQKWKTKGGDVNQSEVMRWADRTMVLRYHWLEMPQVSFLSRQTRVCHNKTRLLSRHKHACRDKRFVAASMFCRDKHVFVTTKHVFCRDTSMLVATKVLSRQVCFVATNMCFVATNMCLSRQTRATKWYLRQLPPLILREEKRNVQEKRFTVLRTVLTMKTRGYL